MSDPPLWRDAEPWEGWFVFRYSAGRKKCEGAHFDGQRCGVWSWYHQSGLEWSQQESLDGNHIGERLTWHESGELWSRGRFNANFGECQQFDEEGIPYWEKDDGVAVGRSRP